MSQKIVERAVGKLVTDEGFRNRFFKNPMKALVNEGLDLSRGELEALARIPQEALAALCERMDDRICRLHLPGESDGQELHP
jgi:hypothetical protein